MTPTLSSLVSEVSSADLKVLIPNISQDLQASIGFLTDNIMSIAKRGAQIPSINIATVYNPSLSCAEESPEILNAYKDGYDLLSQLSNVAETEKDPEKLRTAIVAFASHFANSLKSATNQACNPGKS